MQCRGAVDTSTRIRREQAPKTTHENLSKSLITQEHIVCYCWRLATDIKHFKLADVSI